MLLYTIFTFCLELSLCLISRFEKRRISDSVLLFCNVGLIIELMLLEQREIKGKMIKNCLPLSTDELLSYYILYNNI